MVTYGRCQTEVNTAALCLTASCSLLLASGEPAVAVGALAIHPSCPLIRFVASFKEFVGNVCEKEITCNMRAAHY